MPKRRVRFVRSNWEPVLGDSDSLSFAYEIEPIGVTPPELDLQVSAGIVTINITRTLQSLWNLDRDSLGKALGYYAKEHVSAKAEDYSLTEDEELQLSTYNSPNQPPIDISQLGLIVPAEFEIEIPDLEEEKDMDSIEHAGKIIDLRDGINAIYGEAFENRLLSLPQERALFEMSRTCSTREEFTHRVSSLCELAISIDPNAFTKVTDFMVKGQSIEKLGKFLRAHYPGDLTESVMERISQFNRLRRMYPIHTDRSSGVLAAFEYFGIEYPVQDYQAAWNSLLASYRGMLEMLFSILR